MTYTLRLLQLGIGNAVQGLGVALVLRAGLGLPGWDVFHEGLSKVTGLSFGMANVLVSVTVLLLWIPLRVKPGVGTIINAVLVGVMADLALMVIPGIEGLVPQVLGMVGGTVLFALGTAVYIGAGLGTGPRDGLMQGLAARGISIRAARTILEASALGIGWLLGGTVGVGTVVFSLGVGPLIQLFLPWFELLPALSRRTPAAVLEVAGSEPAPAAAR